MSLELRISATLWGEGAKAVYKMAIDGSDQVFFARVFERDYENASSVDWQRLEEESGTYLDSCSCGKEGNGRYRLDMKVDRYFPYAVFEKLAFDYPNLHALGLYYPFEEADVCGHFYIVDGEFVCMSESRYCGDETELKAFAGDKRAQLEMASRGDDFDELMWAKRAALSGSKRAYKVLAQKYEDMFFVRRSGMYIDLAKKWRKKAGIIKEEIPAED